MPGVAVICKIPTWPRRIKRLKIAKLWLRRLPPPGLDGASPVCRKKLS
jgi:hypothetical protein